MKISIVYASTTGNTEMMANCIAEDLKLESDLSIFTATEANKDDILASDIILLGSPAMGAEVLEDSMEDFFSKIENDLNGKKIGLFGSYDWGNGQWILDWEDRVRNQGGIIVAENLMIHLTPTDEDLEKCSSWAKKLITK